MPFVWLLSIATVPVQGARNIRCFRCRLSRRDQARHRRTTPRCRRHIEFAARRIFLHPGWQTGRVLIGESRRSVAFWLCLAVEQAALDDDFGQFGNRREKSGRLVQVRRCISCRYGTILILEAVEPPLAGFVGLGFGNDAVSALSASLWFDEQRVAMVLEQRQQMMLPPEKSSHKVTGAEQPALISERLLSLMKSTPVFPGLPGPLQRQGQKLIKRFQRFGGIGRPGQRVRKLFNRHGSQRNCSWSAGSAASAKAVP